LGQALGHTLTQGLSMFRALLQPRLAVALLAALAAGLPRTADAQSLAPLDTARMKIVSIPGSLPAARNAVVVLPAGYHASARRYPVLYLLHGHDGGHRNWVDRTNLLAHTARLPLIVVLPDAGNSWYTNSSARPAEKFEEYVAREIPAFIDLHFRTLTYREARYVAGLSMGGYGALKLGLKYPGRFSLVGSFSAAPLAAVGTGSQTRMDAFGSEGSATQAENDLVALTGAASVAAAPYFYIDSGTADALTPDNRTLVQAMQARGLAYEYHEVPGAHTWEFWDRRLPVFLRLVEERIAHLPGAEPISTE
jgi:putative tributyrin esterase